MSDCSENKNPLIRNGTSQGQRALSRQSPASVEIIDKSTEDWMVWAGQLSDHVQYTALNNAPAGTMKPFFTSNVSAQLALVASYKPEQLSQHIRELLDFIETEDAGLKPAFTEIFDIIFSYFLVVDKLFLLTKPDKEYNAILQHHIEAKLRPLEPRTFSYYKASIEIASPQNLIVASQEVDFDIFHELINGHEHFVATGLSNLSEKRFDAVSDFASYYGNYPADDTIFGGLTGFKKRIKYVSQHNFFTSILDEITASATFIVKHSQKYLGNYLSNWPNHQPHYALYLTWLQLLEGSKAHVNELTGRHLDFYYQRVLQLQPLAQVPDVAFLVMELNKVISYYAIKDETVFLGPKDDKGDIISYKSIRETVLNKAKIKHLASLYYGDTEDAIGTQINNRRLFAAPIANSADGMGEELADDVIAWHPFHIKEYDNAALANINMPRAEVGFAIASHYLRLKEGEREVTLTLSMNKAHVLDASDYRAYITTEKGWLQLNSITTEQPYSYHMKFVLSIPAEKNPIVTYNKDVHLGSLNATEPVLKIVLNHKDGEGFKYDNLSNTLIYTAKLKVRVGDVSGNYNEKGIKDLELHNDTSPLNPSKPFHPWGPEPTVGNSFIIGSDEIFYKKGARLQLNFKWKDIPKDLNGEINRLALDFEAGESELYEPFFSTDRTQYVPTVDILKLSKNLWKDLVSDTFVMSNGVVHEVYDSGPAYEVVDQLGLVLSLNSISHKELFLEKDEPWTQYSANSNKGYIKIRLNYDFGHRDYYLALQSFFKLNISTDIAPAYPYQPTLEAFSISYEASCQHNLWTTITDIYENRPMDFYHIGPFGDSEQHRLLQNSVPKFVSPLISKVDGVYKSQGSLFIGLENLQPGDTQSVLFQLQEGSEDPLLEKPEEHLKWEYLTENNVWKSFDDDGVGDNTSGLIESGLINFIIPKDAALEHTAFESNLIWIRCSVEEAPDAVAKIIGIYPNAIKVQRQIPEEKEYGNMLTAAGEIKKLHQPEAKIKKIEQPYTSFDGKPKEGSEVFYLRASERLRHKDRAITIWDCERLVLQEFPEIYKVKCLNHTKIAGSLSEGDLVYNEVAPGHISIITIPDLANRNDIDPLKPYTKKSTLKQVREFLEERSSCQVTIHAAQPDFEEVKVKCNITLRDEYPDINYYKLVIQNDIMNFLSPWAFNSDTDLNFGGRVHQSVLIDFIEELPYVDFLTDFELYHIKSDGTTTKVDEAIASTARSILVSVPAIEHDLTVSLQIPETLTAIDCIDE